MSNKRLRNLPVTDHAVLRWLELYAHVDADAIREQIWRETREALNSGASKITVNGTEYVLKDGRVITVIDRRPPGKPLRWSSKGRAVRGVQ